MAGRRTKAEVSDVLGEGGLAEEPFCSKKKLVEEAGDGFALRLRLNEGCSSSSAVPQSEAFEVRRQGGAVCELFN
jgi:hypothetical protein